MRSAFFGDAQALTPHPAREDMMGAVPPGVLRDCDASCLDELLAFAACVAERPVLHLQSENTEAAQVQLYKENTYELQSRVQNADAMP